MSAMMGADPGYMCALQDGDGHRELPCGHWRKRAIGGVQHNSIGARHLDLQNELPERVPNRALCAFVKSVAVCCGAAGR
jgi:hypothetical protein